MATADLSAALPRPGDWVHRSDADGLWRVIVSGAAAVVVIRAGSVLNRPQAVRPEALRLTATTVAERRLGRNQRAVLDSLRERREWYPGCGWIWSNVSTTVRICQSLARRGLVTGEPTTRAGQQRYLPIEPPGLPATEVAVSGLDAAPAAGPGTATWHACRNPRHRRRVRVRNTNYSSLHGGRRTPSAYSLVVCLDCGHSWRTKAGYVDQLPDLTGTELQECKHHHGA